MAEPMKIAVFFDMTLCTLRVLFCPEDGGRFLQKIGHFVPYFMASLPRQQ
jgi:hypothetical protein